MCFSAEVDVVAGLAVGAVGVDALRHVRRPRDLSLGALPLLLGAHQLTEAFVWWADEGRVSVSTGRTAAWLYVGFAYVVLPLLVPLAVRAVEPDHGRRRVMAWAAVVGGLVALVHLSGMLEHPVRAEVDGHRIAYGTGVDYGGPLAVVYMASTVGGLLASSHRHVVTFGKANVVALPVLALVSTRALASLWCAWAAVTSVVVARHLRQVPCDDGAPWGEATRARWAMIVRSSWPWTTTSSRSAGCAGSSSDGTTATTGS